MVDKNAVIEDNPNYEIPKGFKHLVNWYGEYAMSVVVERAIPRIDGFKPVQRRILYGMHHFEKVKKLTKSTAIVSSANKLHPHGGGSIYEALARMVDSSLNFGVPFIKGHGDFGIVHSDEKPAADRYTSAEFSPMAKYIFNELDSVKFVETEDGDYREPEALPVMFPNILMNPTTGIAVGLATNIYSSNFHEVIKATIELIETGDIKKPLVPDYPFGGEYVYNEKELTKIMETGKGKVKLRGKWHVVGKNIVITKIPYYTNAKSIEKEAIKIQGVTDVKNLSDFQNPLVIQVTCATKKDVESVLTELLRSTDLQMSITTNTTVIIDNQPCVLGVKDLLREWVKFRKNVVQDDLEKELVAVKESIARYELLVDLLSDLDKRDKFVSTLTKKSHNEARMVLRDFYPEADNEVFSWILGLSLRSLSGVASKESKLANLRTSKSQLENDLQDVDGVIVRQLKQIDAENSFPRVIEVTDVDYEFEARSNVVVKPKPVETIVVIENKFVKKLKLTPVTKNVEGIRCMSDDVISFIDNQGRLLRVALESMDFMNKDDRGVYLPAYLEIDDDFEVVCYELIEDKKVGYVYSDGFASVVDYSEWVDSKRTTRMTALGVSPLAGKIIGEIDLNKDYLLMFTRSGKFGFTSTDFKHKNRTARTKLIPVKSDDEIVSVVSITYTDLLMLVSSPDKYTDKLSFLSPNDTFNTEYLSTLT